MEFCALILLECPRKINLHVDNLSLKTGSLFKGIKGIPIGAHYVYYNLDQGVKSGFCFYAERGKIVIKQ